MSRQLWANPRSQALAVELALNAWYVGSTSLCKPSPCCGFKEYIPAASMQCSAAHHTKRCVQNVSGNLANSVFAARRPRTSDMAVSAEE